MIARLALRNVFSEDSAPNSLHYPLFVLTLVAVASSYAFNTVGEQASFVRGGVGIPRGFEDLVAWSTLALSCVLGLVVLLLGLCVADIRSHEMRILSSLGLSRGRAVAMVLCEQAIVLLAALATGIPTGVLFSHALVFVTAFSFFGTVESFGFFLSPRAFGVTLLALLPMACAMALSAVLVASRRTPRVPAGKSPHPRQAPSRLCGCVRLGAGLALIGLSCLWLGWPCLMLVRDRGGFASQVMTGSPLSLAILFLGTWEALRGLGGVMASGGTCAHGRGPRGVLRAISGVDMGLLFWQASLPLSLATSCLALVGYQLAGALGSAHVEATSLDVGAMAYLGGYSSFVLGVAAGTTMAGAVGAHLRSSNREYLSLYGLGLPSGLVLGSQRRRVIGGFAVPCGMAAADVILCLAGRGLARTPYGTPWSQEGVVLAVLLCAVVLGPYLGTTMVSVRNSLRAEAVGRQLRW